ncbi:hypothetical protein [Gehongia tenuis]|uniref:Uncharacterized protein n=1 Tax=Gehongia tenuis TaxID=2763655 RepID=A0A926D2C4_9FIRM|nr:hypothetical protein [Gehongia tenuis]MBC8530468.1 hypothetical protein [Gehongia tenuis]
MKFDPDFPLHLLDYLALRMGCEYLSDLRFLEIDKRMQMARVLLAIPVGAAGPLEWNNTLVYLTGGHGERDPEAVKAQLIASLSEEGG